jgi:D-isomer specific 2-hydroxyacid dehydrogenase, NAD binding domain
MLNILRYAKADIAPIRSKYFGRSCSLVAKRVFAIERFSSLHIRKSKMGNDISNAVDSLGEESRCRIVVISPSSGEDCLTELRFLPRSAHIVAIGNSLEELLKEGYHFMDANVLLNLRGSAESLAPIIREMPNLVWMHSVTAGVDHLLCPEIVDNDQIVLTNAKGIYSSSLAEYVMGAISYFSKDFPRLIKQRQAKNWEKYCVEEIRGKTMGIIGYGDIGVACAKLASAYGMNIVGLRRNPDLSKDDKLVDKVTNCFHYLLAK